MTEQRKFFGNRNNARPYENGNNRYVPPSRHAIFIRGFPSDLEIRKIRDFFESESQSYVSVEFTSTNDEQRQLCVGLRFETHEIAKHMLMKYNQNKALGFPVKITWFKDLKKARDRNLVTVMDENRGYDDRMKGRPEFGRRGGDSRDFSGGGPRRRVPYNSQSREHEEQRSDASGPPRYHRRSSDSDRSRSQSSNRSDRSDSISDIGSDIKSPPPAVVPKPVLQQPEVSVKPAAYSVDLDDEDGVIHSPKEARDEEIAPIDKLQTKHDADDKKKKKKKRKKRRLDRSESAESGQAPMKLAKTSLTLDTETGTFSAIAGDMSNWKQTASDSDDCLIKNNQISRTKTFVSLAGTDKLNSDKSLKLMKMKVENIEKAYKRDSETYSSVVSVLIRKSPDLKGRLESMLKDVLIDLGNQCMDTLREYVVHMSENNPTNLDVSASPASSI